jgi:hypothetical protein
LRGKKKQATTGTKAIWEYLVPRTGLKMQMLHQVVFDFPALPRNVERNLLQFEGYDADDYEGHGAGTSTRHERR